MVTISRKDVTKLAPEKLGFHLTFCVLVTICFVCLIKTFDFVRDPPLKQTSKILTPADPKDFRPPRVFEEKLDVVEKSAGEEGASAGASDGSDSSGGGGGGGSSCPYMSLTDLSPEERHPKASATRHIVDPPADTKLTLVCCQTTKGPWNIAVHESWAPIGAKRFLDMVTSGYWNYKVPLMRCVKNFLCQFGLAGEHSKQFTQNLPDDPQWLPAGPDHRVNEVGVKRFQKGYFSYAGGGPNTRDLQIFVALKDDGPLGGGSPWEVPWGELVGEHSYETLDKIYTGYGEDGPKQGMLYEAGALEKVRKEFPTLDWVNSCEVVDEIDFS
jgi:peptidyl-prolyl cis-trans isomerase A (cyclophilin A)